MIVTCYCCKKPKDADEVDSCESCFLNTCYDCQGFADNFVTCCEVAEKAKEKQHSKITNLRRDAKRQHE